MALPWKQEPKLLLSPAEEPPRLYLEEIKEAAEDEALGYTRRRRPIALALFGLLGALFSFALFRGTFGPPSLSSELLSGTWSLQTLTNAPIGPNSRSAILSQFITFRNGTLRGVTKLRADTDAATYAMPFPDESVSQVLTSIDGRDINVVWNGTYQILSKDRIELRIGSAYYRVVARWDADTQTLEMDHDAILTYPGPARYRRKDTPAVLETVERDKT
jgi:hypothetical protein